MKKLLLPLILLFSITILSSVSYAQTLHRITLEVDTENITRDNLATTCSFGQADGVSNEDFTTEVRVGDMIVWNITASDQNPLPLEYVFVKYVNGAKLLNKNKITPTGNVISANVKKGKKDEVEKYEVKFKVRGKGTFVIDPKIIIKT